MNLSNLKITDGDLILVNIEGPVSNGYIETIRNKLKKWCDQRGLTNVEFMVSGGDFKMTVTKLSVNDVFEDAVLKDKKDG